MKDLPGGMRLSGPIPGWASIWALRIHLDSARKPPHISTFSRKTTDTPRKTPAYDRIRLQIFVRGGMDKRGPVSSPMAKNRLPGLYPLVVWQVPHPGMTSAGIRNDRVSHSASVVMTQCSAIASVHGGVGHGHTGILIHHCSVRISPEYPGVYWPARSRISPGIPRLARLRA